MKSIREKKSRRGQLEAKAELGWLVSDCVCEGLRNTMTVRRRTHDEMAIHNILEERPFQAERIESGTELTCLRKSKEIVWLQQSKQRTRREVAKPLGFRSNSLGLDGAVFVPSMKDKLDTDLHPSSHSFCQNHHLWT